MLLPSVLWRCWLGGRKGIRPVKTEWWGAGVVICLERGADLHTAQLMPLPLTVSCFSKIQIGFTLPVPAYPGSPGQRAVKRVCVSEKEWVCFMLARRAVCCRRVRQRVVLASVYTSLPSARQNVRSTASSLASCSANTADTRYWVLLALSVSLLC